MIVDTMNDLCRHMEWADSRLWSAALEWDAGVPDDDLMGTLVHLHNTQQAFLDVWSGRAPQIWKPEDFAGPPAVLDRARVYHADLRGFLGTLTSDLLAEEVSVPWSSYFSGDDGHPAGPTTLQETLLQAIAHSTHHRGQLNRRLREVGGEPPLLDYIVWLWLRRPPPEWPS